LDPLTSGGPELDRLLSQAHVFQMRGEVARAAELLEQAAELQPENAHVWELRGDLLMEMHRYEDARDAFAKALDLHPDEPRLEKRHARAVFQIQERKFEREQMELMVTNPELARPQLVGPRRPSLAALLSLLVPGSGQLYNGQYVKGGIILGLMVALSLYLLTNPGFNRFVDSILHLTAGRHAPVGGLGFAVSLAAFVALVVYSYALADAVAVALRTGRDYTLPSRPTPPPEADSGDPS
jgi:tetratricopeptide (TPR) repeat protein